MNNHKQLALVCATALTLLLAACNNDHNDADGGDTPAPASVVSGVAAVGSPILGGNVRASCMGGVTRNTTTNDSGAWNASVPTASLPCALRVSGGSMNGGASNTRTLYSLTAGEGSTVIANITPMTDLALSRAVRTANGQTISQWFDANAPQAAQVAGAVGAAQQTLLAGLRDAGYTVPEGLDPFTAVFQAVAGNAYDDLLEAVGDAIEEGGQDYEAFRDGFTDSATVPDAIDDTPAEPEEPGEPEQPAGDFVAGVKPPVATTALFTSKDASCSLAVAAERMALSVAGKAITLPLPDPSGYTRSTLTTVPGDMKRFQSRVVAEDGTRELTLYLDASNAPVLAFASEITDIRPTPLAGANYLIYCAVADYPEGMLEETGPNAAFAAGVLAGTYSAPDDQGNACSFTVAADGAITIDYPTDAVVGTARQIAYTDINGFSGDTQLPSWNYGDPATDGLKAALLRTKASDEADVTRLVLQERQGNTSRTIASCSTENAPGRKFAAIAPAVGTYKGTQAIDTSNTNPAYACTFTIQADGVMTYADSGFTFSVSLDGPDKSYNTISTSNGFYLAGSGTGSLVSAGQTFNGSTRITYTSSNKTAAVHFVGNGGSPTRDPTCRGLVKQ